MSDDFEDALECVMRGLAHPPVEGTDADGDFLRALAIVLATPAPGEHDAVSKAAGLDDDLRRRLLAVAKHRDFPNLFGDHPDGIGRTLGMDLNVKGPASRG